jgi:hypothetical protein
MQGNKLRLKFNAVNILVGQHFIINTWLQSISIYQTQLSIIKNQHNSNHLSKYHQHEAQPLWVNHLSIPIKQNRSRFISIFKFNYHVRYSAKKSGRHGVGVTETTSLPSVLGDTRQRGCLCRVSPNTLSKEVTSLPSVYRPALGKTVPLLPSVRATTLGKEAIPVPRYWFFAECYGPDTQQTPSLPSLTLSKVTSTHLFYLFFLFHPNKQKIHHIYYHIYHIYTSQT